mgnify:CR=1 FL=1
MQQVYDVLIVGGGQVGASLARAIAGSGLRIAVIEALPVQAPAQPSYDDRVIALGWGSRRILEGIGLWADLAASAEPIRRVHISDRGHFGFARIGCREAGVEALGYVLPARDLGRVLHQGLDGLVDLYCPARLLDFRLGAERVDAALELDRQTLSLQARLLVAADGGDSPVRERLGFQAREWSYGQTAVIANVTPVRPHQGGAYERFTDSGPLALLPMTEGRCSLVWTQRDEAVEALLAHCNPAGCLALPVNAGSLPLWSTLADRLLTKSGGWWARAQGRHGFPANNKVPATERDELRAWKDDYKALLDRLRSEEELRAQLELVRGLPAPRYDDDAWSALESLVRILLRAAAEWQLVLAETGGADFTEVARRAIQALGDDGEPSDLALRLDYRISHLLVDEFQDTSHGQVRLLERLTAGWSAGDGRTLFLVGDPMQSIYRFRKAEVSLFIRAYEGRLFPQLRLEPLRLEVNFRSDRPVVDWVNRVFPAVMPRHDDPVKGAVRYSPAALRPDAGADGTVGITLQAVRDEAAEAERVVELTQIDPWYIDNMAEMVEMENRFISE